MVYSIQILRGVAAALIMVHHFNQMLPDKKFGLVLFGYGGAAGVDIFFLISGFVMVWSTENPRHAQPAVFALRRFFRVVPLAQVCTLLYFALLASTPALPILLRSLCFIPLAASDPPKYGWSLVPQMWTLSYEIWFYALFGVALLVTHRWRVLTTSALILSALFIFQHLLGGPFSWLPHGMYLPAGDSHALRPVFFGVMGNPLLLEFVAGMFLAGIYRHLGDFLVTPTQRITARVVAVALLGIFGAIYFSAYDPGHGLLNKHGYSAFCLVLGALLFEASFAFPAGHAPNNKILAVFLWLGAVSYPLYLVHLGIVDSVVQRLSFWITSLPRDGLGGFLLYVTLSLGFAHLLHICVEIPFIALGKKLASRHAAH